MRLGALVPIGAWACLPKTAVAYIGPGPGITLIGALIGVGVAVLLAVGGVVLWPLRAYLRKRRSARARAPGETPGAHPPSAKAGGDGTGEEV